MHPSSMPLQAETYAILDGSKAAQRNNTSWIRAFTDSKTLSNILSSHHPAPWEVRYICQDILYHAKEVSVTQWTHINRNNTKAHNLANYGRWHDPRFPRRASPRLLCHEASSSFFEGEPPPFFCQEAQGSFFDRGIPPPVLFVRLTPPPFCYQEALASVLEQGASPSFQCINSP